MRTKQLYLQYISVFICLCLASTAFGQLVQKAEYPLKIDESLSSDAQPAIEYLEDASHELTFEDVSSGAYASKFSSYEKSFGITSSYYWFRFTIQAESEEEKEWWLEINYPLLDSIEMFIVSESGGVERKLGGDLLPFDERELNYRSFVFPFKSKGSREFTYYVQVKTTSSLDLPVTIWNPQAFTNDRLQGYIGLGLYYGVILVMLFYNLFLFFTLRDINYIYYIFIISSIGLFQFTFNGLAYQFLWSDYPWWNTVAIPFSVALMGVSLMNFARNFLDIKRISPNTNRVMLFFQALSAISLVCVFINYRVMIKLVIGLGLLEIIMSIVAGVISWRRGFGPARFFLVAWLAFLLGMTAQALRAFGFLPNTFLTLYSAQIGSALEVVLLAIALADRISTLKNQIAKEKLDRERLKAEQEAEKKRIIERQKEDLELQVEARTAEVLQQNHEIQTQRDRIQEQSQKLQQAVQELSKTNRNIKNSIQYAQRIQNSILPSDDIMSRLLPKEHFVFYKPRDIVSGDFYWVSQVNGYLFLALADCTGHGVPGALMSVIGSSSLSQLVNNQQMTDPAEILNELNRNVEQMLHQGLNGLGSSRDGMDLALIRVDYPNRKVMFSGAKMSAFTCRDGSIIELKGDKFPIGGGQYKNRKSYTSQEIDISQPTNLYLTTDGFLDQFGGDESRKFSKKRFKELVCQHANFPMPDQSVIFESTFHNWQKEERQIDDVSVMGIRF